MSAKSAKLDPVEAACLGKIKFLTYEAAAACIKRQYGSVKKMNGARPFRCPHCNFHHMGGGAARKR